MRLAEGGAGATVAAKQVVCVTLDYHCRTTTAETVLITLVVVSFISCAAHNDKCTTNPCFIQPWSCCSLQLANTVRPMKKLRSQTQLAKHDIRAFMWDLTWLQVFRCRDVLLPQSVRGSPAEVM